MIQAIKYKLALVSTIVLAGCATPSHEYNGEQRSENEIAIIRGTSVIERDTGKPNIVIHGWKINGNLSRSGMAVANTYAVLPGKMEVGTVVTLVTLLPVSLRRFEGTYWVPFEARAGKTYQFYAEIKDGEVPLKVCAVEVPKNSSYAITETAKMPDGVTIVGCGSPRNPIESYSTISCSGIGGCPITDEVLKP